MSAKVVIELNTQEHNLLKLFLREGIRAASLGVDGNGDKVELDPDDGERLMGEIA